MRQHFTDDGAGLDEFRQLVAVDAAINQRIVPICLVDDIEIVRKRIDRIFPDKLPRQAENNVVLEKKEFFCLLKNIVLVILQPQDFCQRPRRNDLRLACYPIAYVFVEDG